MPRVRVVIGKNFGDEGKGLAVDHFSAAFFGRTLVIRHNGGAQSGHTVEVFSSSEGGSGENENCRFIFHELSSGSFRRADTFWAETYFPDLYKLPEELESFQRESGLSPKIFCDDQATPVLIDDVLQNMLLEAGRGDGRHGSCGMGINEAFLRKQAGYGLTFGEIRKLGKEALADRLLQVRDQYGRSRLKEILSEIGQNAAREGVREYLDLLTDREVLEQEAEGMLSGASLVSPVEDASSFVRSYDQILFETGQGLLLDAEYKPFAPHLTSSRTGMTNPSNLLASWGLTADEVCYVTRTYVTRHGAGPLPYETEKETLGITETDLTNLENDWQGRIRYAPHGSLEDFLAPVIGDLAECRAPAVSLFVTHLNETDGRILFFRNGNISPMTCDELIAKKEFRDHFSGIYLSDGKDQIRTVYRSVRAPEGDQTDASAQNT